jgi:nickel-type superoxide dismutase maturation protease
MIKVTGESLSPLFHEGDYVLIATIPFMIRKIRPGDTIVFQHPTYGIMIKQVESAAPDDGSISVIGASPNSVDSRQFGPVTRQALIGRVIWHIPKSAR